MHGGVAAVEAELEGGTRGKKGRDIERESEKRGRLGERCAVIGEDELVWERGRGETGWEEEGKAEKKE